MKQLSFLMILFSALLFCSFSAVENTESDYRTEPFLVANVIKVDRSNQTVQRFLGDRTLSSLKNLQIDNAQIASYQNTNIKALIIPQGGKRDYNKSVVAFFIDNGAFRTVLMETVMTRPQMGSLNFYHIDNTLIASISVSGRQITKMDLKDNSRNPRWSGDVFWDCVKSCKGDESTKGPSWLQIGCDFDVVSEACKAGQYAHCMKKCW